MAFGQRFGSSEDLDRFDQLTKMVLGQGFASIKQADVLQCFYFFEEHFSRN
jgi:trehalose/maltose hydrolase-like predicted phosphorylase